MEVIYPDDRILLSSKENYYIYNKMDKYQKYYAELEETRQKRLHSEKIYSYEVLEQVRLIYSDRKQISSFMMLGWGDCQEA